VPSLKKKLVAVDLQLKVVLLFVLVALVPLSIMGVLAMVTAEELIRTRVTNEIEHVATDKAALLERWIS